MSAGWTARRVSAGGRRLCALAQNAVAAASTALSEPQPIRRRARRPRGAAPRRARCHRTPRRTRSRRAPPPGGRRATAATRAGRSAGRVVEAGPAKHRGAFVQASLRVGRVALVELALASREDVGADDPGGREGAPGHAVREPVHRQARARIGQPAQKVDRRRVRVDRRGAFVVWDHEDGEIGRADADLAEHRHRVRARVDGERGDVVQRHEQGGARPRHGHCSASASTSGHRCEYAAPSQRSIMALRPSAAIRLARRGSSRTRPMAAARPAAPSS